MTVVRALVLAVAGVLAATGVVRADDVAVAKVEGPRAGAIQRAIVQQLRKAGHSVTVVDDAADSGNAQVVVVASVSKRKRRFRVRIEVRSAADGRVLGKTTFRARRAKALPQLIRKRFRKRLGKSVQLGTATTATEPDNYPEPEPVPELAPEPDPQLELDPASAPADAATPTNSAGTAGSVRTSAPPAGRLVDATVSVSGRVFSRRLRYNDDLLDSLAEHQADVTPAIVLGGRAYFGAFGIAGELAYTRPFNSRNSADVAFETAALGYAVGGRYRLAIAGMQIDVGADYGGRNLTIADAATVSKPDIPDVEYRFVRGSLAARRDFGPTWLAGADAGYRYVLSAGEIESDAYFPRLTVAGVDAAAFVGYRIAGPWQVELSAVAERYFFSLNPEPGDARIAGGAIDQYLGVQLGVAFRP